MPLIMPFSLRRRVRASKPTAKVWIGGASVWRAARAATAPESIPPLTNTPIGTSRLSRLTPGRLHPVHDGAGVPPEAGGHKPGDATHFTFSLSSL